MNMKKLFLLNLPYLLFVYPFDNRTHRQTPQGGEPYR